MMVSMKDTELSVVDILEQIEGLQGTCAKVDVLMENVKNDLLHRAFIAGLDPNAVYYVTKFKVAPHAEHTLNDDDVIEQFLTLLAALADRTMTGNAAKSAVEEFFVELDWRQQKWCKRILLKKMRCGVQCSTLNKVWPDTIKKFAVQLASTFPNTYDKETHTIKLLDRPAYPVRVEPKLDGLRCIAVKHAGKVSLYTRNGTPIDDTLPKIKAALEAAQHDDFVLDGECLASDWNQTTSIIMSNVSRKDDSDMVYNVFDVLPYVEWVDKVSSPELPYSDRIMIVSEIVSALPGGAPIVQVPGHNVSCDEELMACYRDAVEKRFEGIMLKDTTAPYLFKRGKAIQKLKPVTTFEGVICGHYNGREGTNLESQFGGFLVVIPHEASGRGIITRVGGGFSKEFRAEVQLVGADSYIGKIAEVEGQPDPATPDGLSVDGKVRFPVFTRFRDASDVDPIVMETYENFCESNKH